MRPETPYARTFLAGLALCAVVAVPPAATEARPGGQERQPRVDVTELADGVYLFTYNVHRSLFVVGDEAVMVTDPQSPEAATRYLEAVRQVTDRPIRYVVYSHHHADHVSGAEVFDDDVTIVAHRNVLAHLDGGVVPPDLVFARETVLRLGGVDVNLVYPGPSETDNNIIAWVPARDVAFMVDAVFVRTLPWRDLGGADPIEWIEALEELHDLDFEILAPGHGNTGTREHVREFILYLESLVSAVEQRMGAGRSLAEIQTTLELPQYADWVRYEDHFDMNIDGVYRALERRRRPAPASARPPGRLGPGRPGRPGPPATRRVGRAPTRARGDPARDGAAAGAGRRPPPRSRP